MGIEPAGEPGEEGADDECGDLVFCGVDSHGLGGDLVIPHGDETASVGRIHKARHHIDADGRDAEGPEQIGVRRDAFEATGASKRIGVLNHNADDFSETERDDGEVVAAQSQRWHPDQEPAEGCKDAAREQGAQKSRLGLPLWRLRENRRQ